MKVTIRRVPEDYENYQPWLEHPGNWRVLCRLVLQFGADLLQRLSSALRWRAVK